MKALYSGTSECVIAGGVNLIIDPIQYIGLVSAQACFLAATSAGRSATGGDGIVAGEGVGAVVLKPLRQRDCRTATTSTASSGARHQSRRQDQRLHGAQSRARRPHWSRALARRGRRPAHHQLRRSPRNRHRARRPDRDRRLDARPTSAGTQDKQYLRDRLGEVEHRPLRSAAGIAGSPKCCCRCSTGSWCPRCTPSTLNPYIDFARSPFVVQQSWRRGSGRIGIDGRTHGISAHRRHQLVRCGRLECAPDRRGVFEDRRRSKRGLVLPHPSVPLVRKDAGTASAKGAGPARSASYGIIRSTDEAYTLQAGREASKSGGSIVTSSTQLIGNSRDSLAARRTARNCRGA